MRLRHSLALFGELQAQRTAGLRLTVERLRNRGRALTREQLLSQIWGYDFVGDTRTVDVHVRWLRKKIEDEPASPRRLITVRGTGYRFDA